MQKVLIQAKSCNKKISTFVRFLMNEKQWILQKIFNIPLIKSEVLGITMKK